MAVIIVSYTIQLPDFDQVGENKHHRVSNSAQRASGDHIRISFRGKSGVWNEGRVSDRRLARIIKRCRDLPGYELFQYLDEEGERHSPATDKLGRRLARGGGDRSRSRGALMGSIRGRGIQRPD